MNNYTIGDVLLVDYPYDNSIQSKLRPAIVVNDNQILVLCMYVTSKNKDHHYSIEILDWKQAGLESPSWARIDRVAPIEEYQVFERLGVLSDRDFEKIFTLYKKYVLKDFREFSLLAIKNPDGKFLQKYDERWDCRLFPYFRTEEDNKAAADKIASELVQNKVYTQYVTTAKHCKYSVSDQVYKIYNHKLYRLNLDILPEHMTGDEFEINGTKYSWLSIRQMENSSVIMEKNEEIVAFVKCNCK